MKAHFYRTQTKFAKVIFSQVSVCPQVEDVCHTPPTLGRHPLSSACWDTRTPYPVHAGIQSTSRRYASHWNKFLFNLIFVAAQCEHQIAFSMSLSGRDVAFAFHFCSKINQPLCLWMRTDYSRTLWDFSYKCKYL